MRACENRRTRGRSRAAQAAAFRRSLEVTAEVAEAGRVELRVDRRIRDVLVSHVSLNRPGVGAFTGELVAFRVAEHVRVHRKRELGCDARLCDDVVECPLRQRSFPFRGEYPTLVAVLVALQLPQCLHLVRSEEVHGLNAVLHSSYKNGLPVPIDVSPLERDQLTGSERVSITHQHSQGVAVWVRPE